MNYALSFHLTLTISSQLSIRIFCNEAHSTLLNYFNKIELNNAIKNTSIQTNRILNMITIIRLEHRLGTGTEPACYQHQSKVTYEGVMADKPAGKRRLRRLTNRP